jgi:protoheme IX farnesyltransferase
MSGYARLATVSAVGVYLLIVFGAVVRVTGSGLGCPDWPLCHGGLVPPAELTAIVEYVHRTVAVVVGLPLTALFVATWMRQRHARSVFWSVNLLMLLLIPQVLLGREVVLRELPPPLVAIHLANALAIMALATLTAAQAAFGAGTADWIAHARGAAGASHARFPRLVGLTVAATFALLLTGAYVRAVGASWVCLGFPLCQGGTLPLGDRLVEVQLLHRTVGVAVGLLIIYQAWWLARAFARARRVVAASSLAALAVVAQVVVGVLQVAAAPLPLLQILHVALGSLTWAAVVATAVLVHQDVTRGRVAVLPSEPGDAPAGLTVPRGGWAYLSLTKPRIIVLLLITATGGMVLAAEGLPPLGTLVFTLIGGALAAGGANAINCYIDRDIDGLMARTTLRPIPAGEIPPARALAFGVGLILASLALFWLFVNPASGMLAVGAMLYYVFVYSRWLKRSTPSNIVIGGAAGALPPVIGWVAVRGSIDLLPIWLFVIVFYWTPPHFWALSLLIKRQYERARVPMLPIVRGDDETRRQILWYSLLLVALTAVIVPFGLMGPLYLVLALGLGGQFVYYALRLRSEQSSGAARRLYRYSIYYLALLFAAMVVDRQIPL